MRLMITPMLHNNAHAHRPPRVDQLCCKGDLRRVMGTVILPPQRYCIVVLFLWSDIESFGSFGCRNLCCVREKKLDSIADKRNELGRSFFGKSGRN
jgi:hypothetical protein